MLPELMIRAQRFADGAAVELPARALTCNEAKPVARLSRVLGAELEGDSLESALGDRGS